MYVWCASIHQISRYQYWSNNRFVEKLNWCISLLRLLNNRLDKICCLLHHIKNQCVCVTHSINISASQAEPGRPLPAPLHNPLVLDQLTRRFALIQDDSLHGRGLQRAAFHRFYLLTNQSRLFAHLSVTEATHDVFLLQVATLGTRLDVVLRERESEIETVSQTM